MKGEIVDMPFDDSERGTATPQQARKEQPPKKPAGGMREEVLSLEEGRVVLQWPERLSKQSASDMLDWIKLVKNRIKRGAD